MPRSFALRRPGFRRKTAFLCGLAFSIAVPLAAFHRHLLSHREHSHHTLLTADQVSRRIADLSPAFGAPVELLGAPEYRDEDFHIWGGGFGHRTVWVTACQANGRRYSVVFNDKTGNLTFLFCETDRDSNPDRVMIAPIETRMQAAEAALHRLRDLRLINPGTKVSLKQPPEKIDDGKDWRVVWLARQPSVPQPYEVRLTLDRIGGVPHEAVNRYEMTRYATQ